MSGINLKEHVFIIAEAGVNHNGDMALAYQLVDAAQKSGADAVKFQTFKADSLVTSKGEMADYQKKNIGTEVSQHEMLKSLELSYGNFEALKAYCDAKGILFLSSAFDEEGVDFLNDLQPYYKVPSGEITNYPYLKRVAEKGKPIILSTGMATLEEVRQALVWIKRVNGGVAVTLLHCTTNYPTPYEEVNLRAMKTLQETFSCPVGYSDHTLGFEVPLAAVAMGAVVIEKHFTLDCNLKGPDHRASMEPEDFSAMVKMIRHIEVAMGSGEKTPSASELKIRDRVRKSLVASRQLTAGTVIAESDLVVKRPGDGIPPHQFDSVVGRTVKRVIEQDELICWDKLLD